jgi:hypothetical protein
VRILFQIPTTVLVEPSSPNDYLRLISPRQGIQNFLALCHLDRLFGTGHSTIVQGFDAILAPQGALALRSHHLLKLTV